MAKKTQNSMKKSTLSFSDSLLGSVKELLSWRERGLTQTDKEILMDKQLKWASLDTSLQLGAFYRSVGIPKETWEGYVQRHEDMRLVHELTKYTIGERRERLAWFSRDNGVDPKSMVFTLRLYHPDWREIYEEDKAARKDISQVGASNIELVLDGVRQTEVVAEKEANG